MDITGQWRKRQQEMRVLVVCKAAMNPKLSLGLQYSIHRIREGKNGHGTTGPFILQQSVTGYEGSQVRRLELIVLDGAINDIDVSIDRLQSDEVSIHGGTKWRAEPLSYRQSGRCR